MRQQAKDEISVHSFLEHLCLLSFLVLETDNQVYGFALHCCDTMAETNFKEEKLNWLTVQKCQSTVPLHRASWLGGMAERSVGVLMSSSVTCPQCLHEP